MAEKLIVYQVMNLDREEVLYGCTARSLEDELVRLAKNLQGPTKAWRKGEAVTWRALTGPLDPRGANVLLRQLESGTPPNRFTVLPSS